MLVTWALLFKSEVAATLLMWGYFFAFVLLIWGFVKRHTNNFTALMSAFMILSVPAIGNASMTIKTDMPVAVFIFAHYCYLVESFNRRSMMSRESRCWALLAGVLCGAALGHKLTALPVAFFSSLMVLLNDLYNKKNHSQHYWIYNLLIQSIRFHSLSGSFDFFSHFLAAYIFSGYRKIY